MLFFMPLLNIREQNLSKQKAGSQIGPVCPRATLVPSTSVSQLLGSSAAPGEPHPGVPDSVGLGWSLNLHLSKGPRWHW